MMKAQVGFRVPAYKVTLAHAVFIFSSYSVIPVFRAQVKQLARVYLELSYQDTRTEST